MSDVDKLAATAFLFWIIVVIFFIAILCLQYRFIKKSTERLVVLVTRSALFLPLYSTFLLIVANQPNSLGVMNFFIAVVEGYSFYCFFTLLVTNIGGPSEAVEYMKSAGRQLFCCTSWCPAEPEKFYVKTTWALFYFLVVRSGVYILCALCYYSKGKAAKLFFILFSLIALAILIYALISLLLLYENIYAKCKNLNGILKFMLLKFSVGLIVLQGLIEEFLNSTGTEPYSDDSQFTAAEKTQRNYAVLVMLEFVLLCVPYIYAFGGKISSVTATENDNVASTYSFGGFVCEVFKVWDVFGKLTYTDSMSASLATNQA